MDPGVRIHIMKANPTGYLWSKYKCFLISGCQDMEFWKTLTLSEGKGNLNGNACDRGDYKKLFALRAVELKTRDNYFNQVEYIVNPRHPIDSKSVKIQ